MQLHINDKGYLVINGVGFNPYPFSRITGQTRQEMRNRLATRRASLDAIRGEVERFLADYAGGMNMKRMAAKWGMCEATVKNLIHASGVQRRRRGGRQASHGQAIGTRRERAQRLAEEVGL
jgi:hypothetical protein